jgi:hypothetical protein
MRENEMDEERNIFFIFIGNVEPTVECLGRGKPKDSEQNLSQCHFVHHKYYWIDLGANPLRSEAGH